MREASKVSRSDIVRSHCRAFVGNKPGLAMRVYMDESNTHDGTEWLTVAAAWADEDTWASWKTDWTKAIDPLQVYHSVDVSNRTGACAGWTKQFRDEVVFRAMDVIKKHQIHGRIALINRSWLKLALSHRSDVIAWLGHDYYVAFIWAANRSLEIMKDEGHSRISFFHEENDFELLANIHFRRLTAAVGLPFATLTFGAKGAFEPLQCADIFAYEGMRQLKKGEVSKPLARMDDYSNRVQFLNVTEDQTRKLASMMIDLFDEVTTGK